MALIGTGWPAASPGAPLIQSSIKRLLRYAVAAFFFKTNSVGILRDPSPTTWFAAVSKLPISAAE